MDEKEFKPPGSKRTLHTGQYVSRALGRAQPFAYYLPEEAAEAEEGRYPLLVLLHGMNGCYRDWPTNTRLAAYTAALPLVIVFPDGGNGWYTNAVDGSARYEDDLIQDFLPHIQATFPVQEPGKAWGIGGLSMGGYGAVKLALKYPQLFSLAASHSGSFEKMRTPEVHPVFGDPQKDARLRHTEDLFYLAELVMCRWPTERPFLHLDCGLFDALLEGNRRFAAHLNFLGYPHSYREMRGYHTWPYWDRAIRTALPTIAHALGA